MSRSLSEAGFPDGGVRKKMRKGTHSCFECRRRKIRCIFSTEHAGSCTECFARGSRCVDQEHADNDTVVDNRKNLRERVARLESLVESLLEDRTDRGAAETLRNLAADVLPPTPCSPECSSNNIPGHNGSVPFMTMFDNEVISRADPQSQPATAASQGPEQFQKHSPAQSSEAMQARSYDLHFNCTDNQLDTNEEVNKFKKSKEKRTRAILLDALPSNETLQRSIIIASEWWGFWRTTMPGTAGNMNLQQFAVKAITDGTPAQVALLLLAVGVAGEMEDLSRYLALVHATIVSDDDYMTGIDGLECALLQAKCYAEIGQPRRGWLTVRRCLTFAQLTGLHRNHAKNQAWDSIWWTMFNHDRFLSLLLGLPYGIADSHCDFSVYQPSSNTTSQPPFQFMIRLSRLAAAVIDRTQGNIESVSYAPALDLDAQLDSLVAEMGSEWWDIHSSIDNHTNSPKNFLFRSRILAQIFFHQLRVYLHLPFMLRSATDPKFAYSCTACFRAARQLLGLYHILRGSAASYSNNPAADSSTEPEKPLYECKVVDFVGFTAAVLLMLGLLGYGRLENTSNNTTTNAAQAEDDVRDWRLVEATMAIFAHASTEKGGTVAAQSLRVLQQLCSVRDSDYDIVGEGPQGCMSRTVIPYFGTITVRRGRRFRCLAGNRGSASSSGNAAADTAASAAPAAAPAPPRAPAATSAGLSRPSPSVGSANCTATSTGNTCTAGTADSDASCACYNSYYSPPASNHASSTSSSSSAAAPASGSGATDPLVAFDGLYMYGMHGGGFEAGANSNAASTGSSFGGSASGVPDDGSFGGGTDAGDGLGLGVGVGVGMGMGMGMGMGAPGWGGLGMDIDQDWMWGLGSGGL
ncbi:uncharacterized protein K452DRAFT_250611 [Aplosporella prunicola CBS 121167]|uniref:Zn(2)-C6 fungal-type domain-containing protein n=1 Tax=Aplosporella prunicola CBS 121167 TaxID=1176127 RepID=A0A6A6BFS9_9PEZI|nr:uncharacterized protein K452DRAFT_250611 [Aplosporella prunicola CBS 121167]KAF2141777.1 hypothetical protein K452DRAFT_250611 [Aplosporella prunicola CBS 121167]